MGETEGATDGAPTTETTEVTEEPVEIKPEKEKEKDDGSVWNIFFSYFAILASCFKIVLAKLELHLPIFPLVFFPKYTMRNNGLEHQN